MLFGEDDDWLSTDASSAKSDAKTVVTYLGEQSSDVGYFGPSYLNFGRKKCYQMELIVQHPLLFGLP